MSEPTKLLIVDDESAIRHMIKLAMNNQPFDIQEASTCQQAKHHCQLIPPDLIILDWMLPDQSGYDMLTWIRQHKSLHHTPIIMLTAKAEETHKVKALSHGADDYMTKPFSPLELIARIQSILRRGPLKTSSQTLQHQALRLNVDERTVHIHNNAIQLTTIQFSLLAFFMKKPLRAFTRDQLITAIWGQNRHIDERTIDAQIKRLREKLKPFQYHHCIKTVHGFGYQLTEVST